MYLQQTEAVVQGDAIQQALATSSVMLEDQENQLQTVNPEMLHQTSVESTTTENLNTSNGEFTIFCNVWWHRPNDFTIFGEPTKGCTFLMQDIRNKYGSTCMST